MKRRLALVAATVLVALTFAACGNSDANAPAGSQPASNGSALAYATSTPPWPAPTADVPARVAAAGLDLGPMGTAEHYHPKLEIIIDSEQVQVPANIGVDPTTGAMSALHTHETDGTIHIEADSVGEVFTLGQLFTEWGVKLTTTEIGGVTAGAGDTVKITSNGKPVTGAPGDLRLEPDQKIVLRLP